VVDANWFNGTGVPLSYFATSWVVPPPPVTSSGQTIFIFNGIQNDVGHILQPVLQWGSSGAGGGDYWGVASWYAENGPSLHTGLIRVDPGTVLRGVMAAIPLRPSPGGSSFSYSCQFFGIEGTFVPVHAIPELTFAVETLEVVHVTRCSDYPDAVCTQMTDIEIKLEADQAVFAWNAADLVTDCGQRAVVVSSASPGGEVDFFYGPAAPPQSVGLAATSAGPALATFGASLYLAWKPAGYPNIYWTTFDGSAWGPDAPDEVPGAVADGAPALAAFGDYLYAAWKGPGPDQGIFWSAYDGQTWAAPAQLPGFGSSVGPALTACGDHLYMAWKGAGADTQIWWAAFDGATWTPQSRLAGAASDVGPALGTYLESIVVMAWRGPGGDQGIQTASYDGSAWTAPTTVPAIGTAVGPALAPPPRPRKAAWMAWDGPAGDDRVYWDERDGLTWMPQRALPGASTSHPTTSDRPALARYNGMVFMAWKGPAGDPTIYWTTLAD
jgi:hypothetical protein